MIKNIITITIFINFVLHSVNSDKAWDRVDVERAPRHRYKYNRPVDETYASIPVAVVYEDGSSSGISEENSFKKEQTGTGKTESGVKDPNLKDSNINEPFSRNAKDFKDGVVNTTSESVSNIDINVIKILNIDKNIEITTIKNTDDILINFSLNTKDEKDTKAVQVTNKFENEHFSKDHEHMVNTKVKSNTTNEKLADDAHSSPKNDKSSRENIKLLPHYNAKEIHIPVAVIYETEADPISPTTQVPTTITRIDRDKEKIETTTSRKRKPHKHKEIQHENKFQRNAAVVPKVQQTSVIPQTEPTVAPHDEQISVTTKKVEFRSRTAENSVKLTNENNTKNGKKRRERDPVVPIIESKNQIYSQTGEFRYR